MVDNLYRFICVHLRRISFLLFNDLLSTMAMMVFSDKHKSQYRDPFFVGPGFH